MHTHGMMTFLKECLDLGMSLRLTYNILLVSEALGVDRREVRDKVLLNPEYLSMMRNI